MSAIGIRENTTLNVQIVEEAPNYKVTSNMNQKEILGTGLVIIYGIAGICWIFWVLKDAVRTFSYQRKFSNAILNRLNNNKELKPKEFFDIATGCQLNRNFAIKRLKELNILETESVVYENLQNLIDIVEDYAPIQTSKAGFLANLSAVEKVINNTKEAKDDFLGVKNEISSISEKLTEYEQSKRFNKVVGWLSIVGIFLSGIGIWLSLSMTSPDAKQIAIEIIKIQSNSLEK